MTWWWLSFCDPDKPRGSQFLGVVIVRGESMVEAVLTAHRLGINPGGSVMGAAFKGLGDWTVPEEFADRLLSREDALRADEAFTGHVVPTESG